MKALLTVLALSLFTAQANAAVNCYGVQEQKGARGTLVAQDRDNLVISYTDTDSVRHRCELSFDEKYKPRNPSPKYDRYYTGDERGSKACGAILAMVSKTLRTEGKGYVNVEFACGSGGGCAHGESGRIDGFFCDLNR